MWKVPQELNNNMTGSEKGSTDGVGRNSSDAAARFPILGLPLLLLLGPAAATLTTSDTLLWLCSCCAPVFFLLMLLHPSPTPHTSHPKHPHKSLTQQPHNILHHSPQQHHSSVIEYRIRIPNTNTELTPNTVTLGFCFLRSVICLCKVNNNITGVGVILESILWILWTLRVSWSCLQFGGVAVVAESRQGRLSVEYLSKPADAYFMMISEIKVLQKVGVGRGKALRSEDAMV